ncbi:MAG: conjugal transfer protein TraF [Sideroxyarcus sp.]|nr:conjugal transfer protein TraF [Sideroxyarcus sp.]
MRLAHTLLWAITVLAPLTALAVEGRDYPSSIGYSSEWKCNGQGKFSWYCEDEPAPQQTDNESNAAPKATETREELAVKELEKIRKDLDAKRALSVVHPTPENIKAYMAAQQVEIERAAYYADVWRRVLWQSAELNLGLKNPMNNSAIKVKNRERDKVEIDTITELAKEWGIFFFFKGDCPYCKHMVPALQWLTRSYDMTILSISMDGTSIDGLPPAVQDNGLAQKLGVEVVPLFVLGNVKTGKMVIIGSGVLSLQDFVERIYVLTQTKPGEL